MNNVTRYEFEVYEGGGEVVISETGGFVDYDDYQKLVAENAALREQSEDVYAAGYNHGHLNTVDGIAYAPCTKDEFYGLALQVMAEWETPATDAAIAEIGAKAVEAEFSRTPDAEIKWDGTNLTVQNVRDGFSFGVTPVFVAANLRAGRKG